MGIQRALESLSESESQELADELIKSIHAKGGRHLSREEKIAFLENPPALLNGGECLPASSRGPRTKRTYYDLRYERLKGKYHRLKRLPESGADSRRGAGLVLREVEKVAGKFCCQPERKLTGLVSRELEAQGLAFDRKAIREALKRLGDIRGKTTPN
jgi:hypothetical protein